MNLSTPAYRSRAVRALVILHEENLRRYLHVWERARRSSVALPPTKDPAYASLDMLNRHVLGASRGYIVWICEVLQLPDPDIRAVPDVEALSRDAEGYMEHVLERWQARLCAIDDTQLDSPEYRSRWNTLYSIDAMLEHAVMHPIRHAFQLEELMERGTRTMI